MAASGNLRHTITVSLWLLILVLLFVLVLPVYILCKLFLSLLPFDENITNKVVLITGASYGIGEQLAYEYAKKGARLVLCARREQLLKEVAMTSQNLGSPEVLVIPADVSKLEDCKDMVEKTINRFGRLDHLVANAGLAASCPFAEIENISGFKDIMASKAAQIRFYETLRLEVGSDVKFTIVTLGFVDTAMTRGKFMPKDGKVQDNKTPPEIAKFGTLESAEESAKAMLRAACMGKRHLLWPKWFWLPFLTQSLLPEINEWFARRYVTG